VQFKFSQKLIDETIKCFKEENSIDLTSEKANDILNSLSGLFLAYTKRADGCVVRPLQSRTAPPIVALNDLLTHSLNTIEEDK